MSNAFSHAKFTPHCTYQSFSFADRYDPRFSRFGTLHVLNENRIKPSSGFPTHPHRDFEIFNYMISGELTRRDSMLKKVPKAEKVILFYPMCRGDVQFTTGGTGIAHSEYNEHRKDPRGLPPRYHTRRFDEDEKGKAFFPILSPMKGGREASIEEENNAEPSIARTIPIYAEIPVDVFVHLPMTKAGKAVIWLDGREYFPRDGGGVLIE
ncbi:RmlC-like cupin domain-containing protein [Pseudomassariella vexata]|uniref:RmlC-like cupin domain-containing protein n=1 Tax=Pseudomassariella vexata TaxID=1141098 RepID=A0A1Y2DMT9_9PEZI|nr:RmlC-like cupin domain-containing protein [Pseudomassariella vexata]ORY60571.1 RmlC-like cupin domain-containing protein [Pseudomassariella vexata]